MFKKKIGIYALTLAMAAMGMTGCSTGNPNSNSESSSGSIEESAAQTENTSDSEPFSVVCTIFPDFHSCRRTMMFLQKF